MLIPKYFVLNNLHTYMCILFVQDYKMLNFSLSDMDVDDCDQISVGQVFSLTTNSWQEVEAGKSKDMMFCGSTNGFTFDGEIFRFH